VRQGLRGTFQFIINAMEFRPANPEIKDDGEAGYGQ
jgi:hypothetical protein